MATHGLPIVALSISMFRFQWNMVHDAVIVEDDMVTVMRTALTWYNCNITRMEVCSASKCVEFIQEFFKLSS